MKYSVLAVAQIAVGAAAIFARFALTGAGALAVSASRLTIAAAVLLLFSLVRRHAIRPHPRLVWAGVALAAHFACWIWSLEYTSVAASTLLVATTPVWTAIYDAMAHGRRLSALALAAMAAGGAGVYAVVSGAFGHPPVAGHEAEGAALAVAGAIAIAAYFLIVRGVRLKVGTREIVTQTYASAALFLVAASAIAHQAPPAFSDAKAWGGILGMALVSQLLGHTAMNAALRWFSASAVAFSTLLEPVSAAVLALFVFGEGLSAPAVAGGVVLLAAIAVFLIEDQRLAKPA